MATDLGFMQCAETEYHRRPVIVTRSGYTGEVGFELFTYQDIAERAVGRAAGLGPHVRRRPVRARRPRRASARDGLSALRPGPVRGLDARSRPGSRGRSRWTRASSGGARRSCASGRRASPAGCGGCGCTSAGTSPARTTRSSSAISWSGRSPAGPSRRCSAPASRSPTSGPATWSELGRRGRGGHPGAAGDRHRGAAAVRGRSPR